MGQVIFVVCRESIEALLVIGILYAWTRSRPDGRQARAWIYGGILAGFGLAALLAATLMGVTTFLGGAARDWFEVGMLVLASGLIVQMVMWMRIHGRTMRSEIEESLDASAKASSWTGAFLLSMIAVGREGSETVLFLYGSFLRLDTLGSYLAFFAAAAIGLGLALVLFYLLQIGSRFVSWRWFFRVTEIMLLFLGSALFLTASEKFLNGPLANLELPGWLYSTVWNTSDILNDSSVLGNLLASLFAYRSRPIGWDLLILAIYWVAVLALLRAQRHGQATPRKASTGLATAGK